MGGLLNQAIGAIMGVVIVAISAGIVFAGEAISKFF